MIDEIAYKLVKYMCDYSTSEYIAYGYTDSRAYLS